MEDNSEIIENNEVNVPEVKKDFTGLYEVRDYAPDDKNFIMASFLKGLYYGDSWFSQIPKEIFMVNYKQIIEGMIDNGRCLISVACLTEDPKVIIGYSILTLDCEAIVWVYVKKRWRRNGIGRHLVPKHPMAVTHLTRLGKELLNKLNGAVFNPFHHT